MKRAKHAIPDRLPILKIGDYLQDSEEHFFLSCRDRSKNFDKCSLCEFRFKCYTALPKKKKRGRPKKKTETYDYEYTMVDAIKLVVDTFGGNKWKL